MTKEELATLLNGRERRQELTDQEEKAANDSGLVVVFGASDDLMELRGAIYDEVDSWDGTTVLLDKKGVILRPDQDRLNEEDFDLLMGEYLARKSWGKKLTAVWDQDDYSWIYETDIPHAPFDIMDEDLKYCRGIVFSLNDLK